jgi:hypothetical protein
MCCEFIGRVLIQRFRYGEGEARVQTEAFKDRFTRVGGCGGLFGNGGRRISNCVDSELTVASSPTASRNYSQ